MSQRASTPVDHFQSMEDGLKVFLQGVRGSTPAPGKDFVGVGGNTSCVAITPSGASGPTLILDAGTGLSSVTRSLLGEPFRGHILLTHLHWDHVHGLPFFGAGDRDDADVRVLLPAQGSATPERPGSAAALISGSMSPPHFPIGPDGLRGRWVFDAINPGTMTVGGCKVTAMEVPHKGGRTYGYRVEADGMRVAYLPDHLPTLSMHAGVALARGVDVLLHGGMFAQSESLLAHQFGHATIDEAVAVGVAARVGRLVIVHHAPGRTDNAVEALIRSASSAALPVDVGREGDVVERLNS